MELSDKISILPILLNLKRKIVGVRIIKNKEEYDSINVREIKSKVTYCYMIKRGGSGQHFKAKADKFWCMGASKALGLIDVPENVISGEVYESLGLYIDREVAKSAQKDVKYIEERNYGIEVFPLDDYPNRKFDVAIIVDTSYPIMRITQGYSYYYGINKSIRIGGNQAICSESTATPYLEDDINISMLCSGTRFFAKWDENDISIGIPYSKMNNIIDGIINTINSTEPNEKKLKIIEELSKKGIDLGIELDKNYYI